MFISVTVAYSGIKYLVLHPKSFLKQQTIRGPHGEHNLLFSKEWSISADVPPSYCHQHAPLLFVPAPPGPVTRQRLINFSSLLPVHESSI